LVPDQPPEKSRHDYDAAGRLDRVPDPRGIAGAQTISVRALAG
jgi:hypothetical protein